RTGARRPTIRSRPEVEREDLHVRETRVGVDRRGLPVAPEHDSILAGDDGKGDAMESSGSGLDHERADELVVGEHSEVLGPRRRALDRQESHRRTPPPPDDELRLAAEPGPLLAGVPPVGVETVAENDASEILLTSRFETPEREAGCAEERLLYPTMSTRDERVKSLLP